MRVKMKAVHRELMIFHEYDLPDARAEALIAAGYADAVRSIVPVSKPPERRAEKAVAGPPETATAEPQREESWMLKTPPAEYLDKYPEGPKADLARRILAAGK